MQSLLFNESKIIGCVSLLSVILTYQTKYFIFAVCVLIGLLIFYRYEPHNVRYCDNTIISPAEGKIIYIKQIGENISMSIFMSIFNRHTQVYPVNGVVIDRIHDNTGIYNIVADKDKSRFNEKRIHNIITKNGIVQVTQIAGFLMRCITSSMEYPEKVSAGEYMGMVKFGSRIDITFKGDIKKLKKKQGDAINIGETIYKWN